MSGDGGRIYWENWQKRRILEYWLKSELRIGEYSEVLDVARALLRKWCAEAGGRIENGKPFAPKGGMRYGQLLESKHKRGSAGTPPPPKVRKERVFPVPKPEPLDPAVLKRELAELGVDMDNIMRGTGGRRQFTAQMRWTIVKYIRDHHPGRHRAAAIALGINETQLYLWSRANSGDAPAEDARCFNGARKEEMPEEAIARLRSLGIYWEDVRKDTLGRAAWSPVHKVAIMDYIDKHHAHNLASGARVFGLQVKLLYNWREHRERIEKDAQAERAAVGPVTRRPQVPSEDHPLVGQQLSIDPSSGQVEMPFTQPPRPPVPAAQQQKKDPAPVITEAGSLAFDTPDIQSAVALLANLSATLQGRVRVVLECSE